MKPKYKKSLIIVAVVILITASLTGGAIADRLFGIKPLDKYFPRTENSAGIERVVLKEESVVIDVAERVSPSVVTVTIKTPQRNVLEYVPFQGFRSRVQSGVEQDIGTGFIIASDGLVITNKHVVSTQGVEYKVVTKDGAEYDVVAINKDPSNDIAVLKIEATDLVPVSLGSSTDLKVGQFVVAIGTALGEFRHTVTTGVISGLGRGIVAGTAFEGYVERLDNVIQTDAAINPGNSGGPLLNSSGEVIGVNVAVAQGAQNIGFAIPIDIVKEGLDQFENTGKFVSKPFLGVQYQMVTKASAILNDVPAGAFVVEVIEGSPAQIAGIKVEDIIVSIDGEKLIDLDDGLSSAIAGKKSGDSVAMEIYRDGETRTITTTLSDFGE